MTRHRIGGLLPQLRQRAALRQRLTPLRQVGQQPVHGGGAAGAARAAALIAAADHGLPVYEYSPKKVKSAVVGNGNADKSQVAFMVRALLGLAETPPSDAADALAIGIAHLQASDPLKAKLLDRRLV